MEINIRLLQTLRKYPNGLGKTRIYQMVNLNYSTGQHCFEMLEHLGFVTIREQGEMTGLRTNIMITEKGISILKQLNPAIINLLINLGARLTGFQNP
jgi:predicted transcriptional regulator